MKCSKCGKKTRRYEKFCSNCGTERSKEELERERLEDIADEKLKDEEGEQTPEGTMAAHHSGLVQMIMVEEGYMIVIESPDRTRHVFWGDKCYTGLNLPSRRFFLSKDPTQKGYEINKCEVVAVIVSRVDKVNDEDSSDKRIETLVLFPQFPMEEIILDEVRT